MRTVTSREAFERLAATLDAPARIPVEVRTTVGDPYDAYRRARDEEGGVYLETTGGQDGWGYFATDPERWVQTDASETTPDGFAALDVLLDAERLVRGDCEVPYPCGAFGWFSYDLARELEDLPETTTDERGLPRLQLGVYDRVAAWREPRDGEQTELRVTCCPRISPDEDFSAAYDRAVERARDLARRASEGDAEIEGPPADAESATFRNEVGREEYAERVRRTKAFVRDGDTFQVNVSQRLVAHAAVHPVAAFAALRRVNPAPYSALVEFPGVDLVSASPELLIDCAGDRLVTEPIAGTRPRGEAPEADCELERELLDSEKEHAEHAMLVDLERNDLGKVCEYGTVEVAEYRRIDRYSEVMHTVSKVVGRRRDDASVADAVAAVFPGGTITGAPKPRTMEIIDELESTRRGPYTGAIGVVGFDERATLNMTIRTLVRAGDRYYLRVGAGIVHDSDPDAEYEETLAKGRALVRAMDDALGDDRELAVEE
ncbi:anthranilate synthase component I family protein [Halorussus gelatinilyticus]|uniref:anthranilate synthase n=1 Tax=Halorussus gelatinilyticus TaxID=2937524 RepID=A0A8U0IQJ1_9EURY|nr:anthranilate synthase component I family protein [Halorussus gelatinilyticus]UPW02334.1 anthranilate synthase component I family protein [Halorussus gelatinilyticus]